MRGVQWHHPIWHWGTLSGQSEGKWGFEVIPREGAKLRHMLLLNVNTKPYMGSPTAASDLALSALGRSKIKSWQLFWVVHVGDLYIALCLPVVLNINQDVTYGTCTLLEDRVFRCPSSIPCYAGCCFPIAIQATLVCLVNTLGTFKGNSTTEAKTACLLHY